MGDKEWSEIVTKLRRERDEARAAVEQLHEQRADEIEQMIAERQRKMFCDYERIIDRLTRERDEARAEVERLREDHKYACDVADNLRAEIKTLRNQAVANTEDAERYRWLRSFATWVNEDYESIHHRWNAGEFESVDAAIDAAREGE